jgi:hypothetical protein
MGGGEWSREELSIITCIYGSCLPVGHHPAPQRWTLLCLDVHVCGACPRCGVCSRECRGCQLVWDVHLCGDVHVRGGVLTCAGCLLVGLFTCVGCSLVCWGVHVCLHVCRCPRVVGVLLCAGIWLQDNANMCACARMNFWMNLPMRLSMFVVPRLFTNYPCNRDKTFLLTQKLFSQPRVYCRIYIL